jgi:FixJ family two-component response regulator
MKGGAVDFLPKPFRDQDMLDAVSTAIGRDRRRRAVDGDASRLRERFETLSARERQVMALVAAGKMNKQIAGELAISEMAVKVRRSAVMRKMDVRTVADLIRMADILSPRQP